MFWRDGGTLNSGFLWLGAGPGGCFAAAGHRAKLRPASQPSAQARPPPWLQKSPENTGSVCYLPSAPGCRFLCGGHERTGKSNRLQKAGLGQLFPTTIVCRHERNLMEESPGTPALHPCPTLRWEQGLGERGAMPGSQIVP